MSPSLPSANNILFTISFHSQEKRNRLLPLILFQINFCINQQRIILLEMATERFLSYTYVAAIAIPIANAGGV